jgi:hypothetical protein
MIKRSLHQEDKAILNTDEPNNTAPKHVKETLAELNREIAKPTIRF